MTEKEKTYSSLGEMVKKGDFKKLQETLISFKETEDIEILKSNKSNHVNELDLLLFHMIRFSDAKIFEPKKDDEEETPEISFGLGANMNMGTGNTPPIFVEEQRINPLLEKLEPVVLPNNFIETFELLLSLGANPNTPIKNGITPFIFACSVNNKELAQKMIENPYEEYILHSHEYIPLKADIQIADSKGNGPLYYATMNGALDTLEYLVKDLGMDINTKNFLETDRTLLHIVCSNMPIFSRLDQDGFAWEFIGMDAIELNKEILDKLLDLGADITLEDANNDHPFDLIPTFEPEDTDYDEKEVAKLDEIYDLLINIQPKRPRPGP